MKHAPKKVAVINFSGNVGKTTTTQHLLAPRMSGAEVFAIETINAGASDGSETERLKGKQFGEIQERLLLAESAIVDVGASNVEEFVKLMAQFAGSHEEFDYFVVPVVREKKAIGDTINTIRTLAEIGVPPSKIRVLFNKVDLEDSSALDSQFAAILAFASMDKLCKVNREAIVWANDIYERLKVLRRSLADVLADETDYRAQLRTATDEGEKALALRMIPAKQLAGSAKKNLDAAFAALFA